MTQPPDSSGGGSGDPQPAAPQQPWEHSAAPPPRPNWGQPAFGLTPEQERTWAMFAHVGSIVAGVLLGMSFLGPLVVMLTQGTKSAFVRRHAVESLNFQLTLLIALVGGTVVSLLLLVLTLGLGLLVVIPLAIAAWIASVIVTVIGGIKANNGEEYRYPVNIRMVR